MRPEILFSLYAPVTSLSGVGPKIANLIARVAGDHIVDLLWHLPSGLIDRRYAPKLCDARTGVIATLTVTVIKHIKTLKKFEVLLQIILNHLSTYLEYTH